jgi:ketosteroid isomerase-like protein
MNPAQELIHAVYKAFNERDIATVLRRMHPEVDWPNGMEGGRVHGQQAVREYWERQWKVIDPHVEPVQIEVDESGRQVVTVHQVVRDLTGRVLLDRAVQHIYAIEDGLIRKMDIREAAMAGAAGAE